MGKIGLLGLACGVPQSLNNILTLTWEALRHDKGVEEKGSRDDLLVVLLPDLGPHVPSPELSSPSCPWSREVEGKKIPFQLTTFTRTRGFRN